MSKHAPMRVISRGWVDEAWNPESRCMVGLKPEFDKRNTKIIGLSVDAGERR